MILLMLSEKKHRVLTAIALLRTNACGINDKLELVVTTEVTFKKVTAQLAQTYWLTGEPKDKAGGYGIQGLAGMFVQSINGSYSAVVGLPLAETAELLMSVGIKGWWDGCAA